MLKEAARERIVARFANEALDPPTNPTHQPTNQPTNHTHKGTSEQMGRVATLPVEGETRRGGGRASTHLRVPLLAEGVGAFALDGERALRTLGRESIEPVGAAVGLTVGPLHHGHVVLVKVAPTDGAGQMVLQHAHGGTRHTVVSESSPSVASQQRPGPRSRRARDGRRGGRDRDLVPMHAKRHQQFIGHGLATGAARRGDSTTQTHGTHAQRESACAGGASPPQQPPVSHDGEDVVCTGLSRIGCVGPVVVVVCGGAPRASKPPEG
jgi:hypothetical protein